LKLINFYIKDTTNVGDLTVSPFDYYDFDFPTERVDMRLLSDSMGLIRNNVLIFGGGGLIHLPSTDYNKGVIGYLEELCSSPARVRIAWGIGHNIHDTEYIEYPKYFLDSFDLIGRRDDISCPGTDYVPCVSCKSKLIKKSKKIKHKTVIFAHGSGIDINLQVPKIDAPECTFEEAIQFLSSAQNVITNSYHGAYWARLLDKNTIVYRPFSSKFHAISSDITFCDDEFEVQQAILNPKYNPKYLSACRRRNDAFFKKVSRYIASL